MSVDTHFSWSCSARWHWPPKTYCTQVRTAWLVQWRTSIYRSCYCLLSSSCVLVTDLRYMHQS